MKKALKVMLSLILAFMLCACGTGNDTATENAETSGGTAETAEEEVQKDVSDMRVVLLVKQMANDFWVELADAAQAKADELGVTLEILSPLTADSNEEQIELLEQSLLDPPDAYVIAPADPEGIVPAVEEINAEGIPIVVLDAPITSEDVETLTYIGSNNYALGYDLAKATVEKTGIESGKVIIIEGKTGASSSLQRTEGAEAAYAEMGWEIIDKQPGNWSRDESYNVVQNLLQTYQDVDVIQFNSVSMALGAYEAVTKSGQDIKCVAVDKTSEALQLMVDTDAETLYCLIDNPPDFIGSTGVEKAVAYLQGETVEAEYATSGDIIAPDEEGWQELLDKYGIQAQ